ncbi:MAG: Ig-like domain-containing protein [Acidobacteriota bacterium]
MMHPLRGLGLAGTLVLISMVALVSTANSQSTTTSAYVYVQVGGPAGAVYGYSASSGGQLTAIPGSPFKPGTQIVGGNGSQFFTLGHTLLHSWAVNSNGALGSQLSAVGFLNYTGGSCSDSQYGQNGAVLDHSGAYIYALLQNNADKSCSAYQTWRVNSDGSFTFVGDAEQDWGDQTGNDAPSIDDLPSILGNESFAYADTFNGESAARMGFKRASTGELQLMDLQWTDPPTMTNSWNVELPDASPVGNYVVYQFYNPGYNRQLGVYTVDSSGNLSTTNTFSNMPASQLMSPHSVFSPDGSMVVLYTAAQPIGTLGDGIEIYNFNGPAPLTLNTKLLNGTPIDQVAWDSTHHLYAISRSQGKMWVYAVGAGSAAQTALVSVTSPVSLVVVSQGSSAPAPCSAQVGDGISVCSPSNGAMTHSPVTINATAVVSGGVYRFELWNGSTKLLSEDSGTMNGTVTLAPGSYTLTFDAYNSTKSVHEYAKRTITVQ